MRLIAVSRVRNEADIIEAFVRHHARYFDLLVIDDDGSTDGTYEMLCSLQVAGLPLDVSRVPVVGYEQSRHMTRLLRTAVDRRADWVVPLDADEFIEPAEGRTLAEMLAECEPHLLSIPWANFAWSPDNNAESNPVIRQRLRIRPGAATLRKIVVRAHLIDQHTRISQGNHQLTRNGEAIPGHPLHLVQLCHYPIRSVGAICVQDRHRISPVCRDATLGRRHRLSLCRAVSDPAWRRPRGPQRADARDSHHYSVPRELHQDKVEWEDEPLRYQGGALVLPTRPTSFVQNILHCAEAIARDRAVSFGRRTNEGH